MRRTVLFACILLVLWCAGHALAETATVLSLSKSLVAIKISQPSQRMAEFAPFIEAFTSMTGASEKLRAKKTELTDILARYAAIPGIDAAGDAWIVVMPPAPGTMARVMSGGMPTLPTPNDNPLKSQTYLILPLANPANFQAFLDAPKGREGAQPALPTSKVCGTSAILALDSTELPFTGVTLDLPLVSTRGIVIASHPGNFDPAMLMEGLPPMVAPFMAPALEVMEDERANIQRTEVGLAMQGDTLNIESFTIPKPGSPLAGDLAQPQPTVAMELMGYLPPNLAVCVSNGPARPGITSITSGLTRVGTGIAGVMMPPDKIGAFAIATDTLLDVTSHGRAYGVTAPTRDGSGSPTLIAVYRVRDEARAKAAVDDFIKQAIVFRDGLGEGEVSRIVKIYARPAANMQGRVPIDISRLVIRKLGNTVGDDTDIFNLECHAAYFNGLMVFAAGERSLPEVKDVLVRIQYSQPGYTIGRHYTTIKGELPGAYTGYASLSTAAVARGAASLLVPAKERAPVMLMMNLLSDTTPIHAYETVQDGMIRWEGRVPMSEVNNIVTLISAAAMREQPK